MRVERWSLRFREQQWSPHHRKHIAIAHQLAQTVAHKFRGHPLQPGVSDSTDAPQPLEISYKVGGPRLAVWLPCQRGALPRASELVPNDGMFSSRSRSPVQSKIGSSKSKSISGGDGSDRPITPAFS